MHTDNLPLTIISSKFHDIHADSWSTDRSHPASWRRGYIVKLGIKDVPPSFTKDQLDELNSSLNSSAVTFFFSDNSRQTQTINRFGAVIPVNSASALCSVSVILHSVLYTNILPPQDVPASSSQGGVYTVQLNWPAVSDYLENSPSPAFEHMQLKVVGSKLRTAEGGTYVRE